MLDIYIAGASAELERARAARSLVEQHFGMRLVGLDWVAEIDKARAAGKMDHHLTRAERRELALGDLGGVGLASIVWLLLPPRDVHTVGMWVEFGMALEVPAWTLTSGPDEYLFSAMSDHHLDSDAEAFAWLSEAAQLAGE